MNLDGASIAHWIGCSGEAGFHQRLWGARLLAKEKYAA